MSDRNQPGLQFCSACRGDYEDPEASPDGEHVAPEDKDDGDRDQNDEFPVTQHCF